MRHTAITLIDVHRVLLVIAIVAALALTTIATTRATEPSAAGAQSDAGGAATVAMYDTAAQGTNNTPWG